MYLAATAKSLPETVEDRLRLSTAARGLLGPVKPSGCKLAARPCSQSIGAA